MIDVKWLATCATAGEFLYGQYTASALKKMYESKKGCTISMENLIAAAQELEKSGEILMEYCGGKLEDHDDDFGFFAPKECEGTALEKVMRQADAEGNPYASLHFDDEERTSLMLDTPSDLEYYIPTEKEIKELVENGYIRTPAMTRLEEQIRQKGGDPAFLIPLWAQISTDKQEAMEAVKSILSSAFPAHQQRTAKQQPSEQMGASKGEKQQVTAEKSSHPFAVNNLNSLMPYVNEFINSVNLRVRRGWRPKELSRKTYPHGLTRMPTISPGSAHMAKLMKEAEPQLRAMGVQTDYSSIDNLITVGQHGERRVLKVGRNDPCPCGSGKKYKKCHGRMKG